jgi:ABC-2 type transport system ATP-binding protein
MKMERHQMPGIHQTAIEIDGLCKRFDNFEALKNISLTIAAGEIFGFLGHNGAGKTTTLNILTTLLKPTSGHASINGFDVVADPIGARRRIGYVPENVRLYAGLTANDNLRFLGKLSGLRNPDARIEETLAFLECAELGPKRVGTMSKGQRQRVGLAQALLHHPDVLFLDEPTSGLDPLGIKTLRDLIIRLNRQRGTTVFMNTHLISEIAKTCTSIGVLSNGQLVFHDKIDVVMKRFGDDAALENIYLSLTPAAAVHA